MYACPYKQINGNYSKFNTRARNTICSKNCTDTRTLADFIANVVMIGIPEDFGTLGRLLNVPQTLVNFRVLSRVAMATSTSPGNYN